MARGSRPVDEEVTYAERPLRNDHHDDMLDLKALANRIAAMPQKERRALPLDEEAQEQLDILAASEPRPDRRRTLMRAKLLLGAADQDALQKALAGSSPTALRDRETVYWRTRIIAGGDQDLQTFIEAYPGSDRQALRTHARDARGTGPAAERAAARLLTALREGAAAGAEAGAAEE